MNIIDEQLQLVLLFVPPQGYNLIISFSDLPNLPKKVSGVIFSIVFGPIPQLFGISISNFN
jgi:hypothetical protein